MAGPYFQGGPRRDSRRMVEATAAMRDDGGLPPDGSLIFSQLLLNLAGHAGRAKAEELIAAFLDAADVRALSPKVTGREPCPACGAPCDPELADVLQRLVYVRASQIEHLRTLKPEIAELLAGLVEPTRRG